MAAAPVTRATHPSQGRWWEVGWRPWPGNAVLPLVPMGGRTRATLLEEQEYSILDYQSELIGQNINLNSKNTVVAGIDFKVDQTELVSYRWSWLEYPA